MPSNAALDQFTAKVRSIIRELRIAKHCRVVCVKEWYGQDPQAVRDNLVALPTFIICNSTLDHARLLQRCVPEEDRREGVLVIDEVRSMFPICSSSKKSVDAWMEMICVEGNQPDQMEIGFRHIVFCDGTDFDTPLLIYLFSKKCGVKLRWQRLVGDAEKLRQRNYRGIDKMTLFQNGLTERDRFIRRPCEQYPAGLNIQYIGPDNAVKDKTGAPLAYLRDTGDNRAGEWRIASNIDLSDNAHMYGRNPRGVPRSRIIHKTEYLPKLRGFIDDFLGTAAQVREEFNMRSIFLEATSCTTKTTTSVPMLAENMAFNYGDDLDVVYTHGGTSESTYTVEVRAVRGDVRTLRDKKGKRQAGKSKSSDLVLLPDGTPIPDRFVLEVESKDQDGRIVKTHREIKVHVKVDTEPGTDITFVHIRYHCTFDDYMKLTNTSERPVYFVTNLAAGCQTFNSNKSDFRITHVYVFSQPNGTIGAKIQIIGRAACCSSLDIPVSVLTDGQLWEDIKTVNIVCNKLYAALDTWTNGDADFDMNAFSGIEFTGDEMRILSGYQLGHAKNDVFEDIATRGQEINSDEAGPSAPRQFRMLDWIESDVTDSESGGYSVQDSSSDDESDLSEEILPQPSNRTVSRMNRREHSEDSAFARVLQGIMTTSCILHAANAFGDVTYTDLRRFDADAYAIINGKNRRDILNKEAIREPEDARRVTKRGKANEARFNLTEAGLQFIRMHT
jgi:hypothetical protein